MKVTPVPSPIRRLVPWLAAGLVSLGTVFATPLAAKPPSTSPLEQELGRNEVRIYGAPSLIERGGSIWDYALGERLDQLDYRRVRQRPKAVGEYFWGHKTFWIYRRGYRFAGDDVRADLVRLELDADSGRIGRIASVRPGSDDSSTEAERTSVLLEPMVLAESLKGSRAQRLPFDLDAVPENVWRPVLAAEDARFFEHMGLDARSLARAMLANAKAGKVTQGGSTITQQLIKNRDLTPRRSMRRKASEALRSLMLEAEYDKQDILQAYLNQVYLGHLDGLAIHGLGTGARAYFDKDVADLKLHEAALLAAIIQGPNRLSPLRHEDAARKRRNWVLGRMGELGWAKAKDVERAQKAALGVRQGNLGRPLASHFQTWVRAKAQEEAPKRVDKGRGLRIETSLDSWVQVQAETAVRQQLKNLRRQKGKSVNIALVALDASNGDVVAYVGGDPQEARGGFDRGRSARRQPGSAIKPLLLLEAFEACGARQALYPASRIADEPLEIDLPSGNWEPQNSDRTFHGTVDIRQSMMQSLNIPFVRIARWCGFNATAQRLRKAGLDIPKPPPPAMALGAVETSPLELAAAYSALANGGRSHRPRPVLRIENPSGRRLSKIRPKSKRLVDDTTAYLINDLMRSIVEEGGTARAVQLDGWEVAAKTGTSSERRDAWLAGYGNGLVTVVWVGRDDGKPLGLTGSGAAAPIWKAFMAEAMGRRPRQQISQPSEIVTLYVDRRTGLLVRSTNRHAERELFRESSVPRRDRFWRRDADVPIIR